MARTRSLSAAAGSDKRIDLAIKIVAFLIFATAAGFGVYYYVTQSQMDVKARVSKVSATYAERVRKNPLDADARVALAQAYITEGNYDGAIEQTKQAMKINSEHQGAIVTTGIAYMKKGNKNTAEKYFMKEIEMFASAGYKYENKYLEEAYFDMAAMYFEKKDYAKALGFAAQATEIGRANADNHFLMGRIYLAKGSYEEASLKFQEALKFDPKYADAHYGLGQAYEKMHETKKAIEEYKTVLKLAPGFKGAKDALARLE